MIQKDIDNIFKSWGISLEEASNSDVKATITIHLKYPDIKDMIAIKPEERKKKFKEIYKKQYLALKTDFQLNKLEIIKNRTEPRILTGETELKNIFKILEKEYVENLIIQKIEGYTKKKIDKKTRNVFFAVKAKFGIKIEGIETGLQGWEERIILLKAKNYEDAEKRALVILLESNHTYLNSDKRLVWWHFEEILDVFETSAYTLHDFKEEGVEIYSKMHNRRLKPENVWKIKYDC